MKSYAETFADTLFDTSLDEDQYHEVMDELMKHAQDHWVVTDNPNVEWYVFDDGTAARVEETGDDLNIECGNIEKIPVIPGSDYKH